ncbi:M23 family metallopeptidase [Butyricicoccus sp. AF18-9LB]|uniref:M23 family metallopeptidase n=1 Tax=Butyricicoccus sp. AF18-9LB TaxID=3002521 RepID=UPI0022E96155|nr:peptidoglycan DD-metalloendopeptidase family protein [Butyricicoccus sp. AF18-9LB]
MGSFYDDFKKKQNKSQNKPTLIKVPQVAPKSNDRRATAARNREQQRVQAHGGQTQTTQRVNTQQRTTVRQNTSAGSSQRSTPIVQRTQSTQQNSFGLRSPQQLLNSAQSSSIANVNRFSAKQAAQQRRNPRQNVSTATKSSGDGNPTLTQLLKNSMDWHTTSDPNRKAQLHAQNDSLRRKLGYEYNPQTGASYDKYGHEMTAGVRMAYGSKPTERLNQATQLLHTSGVMGKTDKATVYPTAMQAAQGLDEDYFSGQTGYNAHKTMHDLFNRSDETWSSEDTQSRDRARQELTDEMGRIMKRYGLTYQPRDNADDIMNRLKAAGADEQTLAYVQENIDLRHAADRLGNGMEAIGKRWIASLPSLVDTSRQVSANLAESRQNEEYRQLEEQEQTLELTLQGMNSTAADGSVPADYQAVYDQLQEVKKRKNELTVNKGVDPNKWSQRMLREANEAQANAEAGLAPAPRWLTEQGISLAGNAPVMAASAIPGVGPAVGSLVMGAQAAGQRSFELNERGIGARESLTRGLTSGAIEAATERLPLGQMSKILHSGGVNAVKNILIQMGEEATEESASYFLNYVADKAAQDPDAKFSLQELAQSAAGGAFGGLVFGAAGALGSRAATDTERMNAADAYDYNQVQQLVQLDSELQAALKLPEGPIRERAVQTAQDKMVNALTDMQRQNAARSAELTANYDADLQNHLDLQEKAETAQYLQEQENRALNQRAAVQAMQQMDTQTQNNVIDLQDRLNNAWTELQELDQGDGRLSVAEMQRRNQLMDEIRQLNAQLNEQGVKTGAVMPEIQQNDMIRTADRGNVGEVLNQNPDGSYNAFFRNNETGEEGIHRVEAENAQRIAEPGTYEVASEQQRAAAAEEALNPSLDDSEYQLEYEQQSQPEQPKPLGNYERYGKTTQKAAQELQEQLNSQHSFVYEADEQAARREQHSELRGQYELAQPVRRQLEKFKNNHPLSDKDNSLLQGALLNGATDKFSQADDPAAVMHMYQLMQEEQRLMQPLREYAQARRDALSLSAEEMADAIAEKAKDKRIPGAYSRETMERNSYDIFGKENRQYAETLNEQYFTPVHKAVADRTQYINTVKDRIAKLNLSKHESALVQMMLEGENGAAADYIAAKKIKVTSKLQERVANGVAEFRAIYDDMYNKLCDTLIANGMWDSVPGYLKDYAPHFTVDKPDTKLARVLYKFGIKPDSTLNLPTPIAGITDDRNPGKKWFGNLLHRNGELTEFDAVAGFDRYVETAGDVIFLTDSIQNLRTLEDAIRYRLSDDGTRQKINEIRKDRTLDPLERHQQTQDVYDKNVDDTKKLLDQKHAGMGGYVANLHEYINNLAGKKARADRGWEEMLGRQMYNVAKNVEGRVAANMIALNPGSWITNFIPLTQAAGEVSTPNLLRAAYDTVKSAIRDDGFTDGSVFLTNREGTQMLDRTLTRKVSDLAGMPMEAIDHFTANIVTRGKYLQNIADGMTVNQAFENADAFASNLMADRSKGAQPTAFNAVNPIRKMFTMFQLEVNNQLSYLAKDLPRAKQNKAALAWSYTKIFAGAYLFNQVYHQLTGRDSALDPIGMIADAFGFDPLDDDDKDKKKKSGVDIALDLGENVAEQIPFVGGLLGGGRVPISSAFPDFGKLKEEYENGYDNKRIALDAAKSAANSAAYLLLPFGGGAVKKALEGAATVYAGGSYSLDKNGEKILQFPQYGQSPRDWAQAMLFGKSSLQGAQNWADDDYQSLNADETKAFDELRQHMNWFKDENGNTIDNSEAVFAAIKAMRAITDEMKEKYPDDYTAIAAGKKREMLFNDNDLNEIQKKYLDRELIGSSVGASGDYSSRDMFDISQKVREARQDDAMEALKHGISVDEFANWDGIIEETLADNEVDAKDFVEGQNNELYKKNEALLAILNEYGNSGEHTDAEKNAFADYLLISAMEDSDKERWDEVKGTVNATDFVKFASDMTTYNKEYKGSGLSKSDAMQSILDGYKNLSDTQKDALFGVYSDSASGNAFHISKYEEAIKGNSFYSYLKDAGKKELRSLLNSYEKHVADNAKLDGWEAKAAVAKEAGISPGIYALFQVALQEADTDGKGLSQAKAKAAVESVGGLTQAQKAYLWQSANKSWKKNPYGSATVSEYKYAGGEFANPVEGGTISSKFGPRDTFATSNGASSSRWHKSIDIAAPAGTAIKSVQGGKVTANGWVSGYGWTIEVKHDNGYVSMYHHMQNQSSVAVGTEVKQGQTIGNVGSTGNSTGPHLDLTITKDGTPVDPASLIGDYKNAKTGYVYEGSPVYTQLSSAASKSKKSSGGSSRSSGGSSSGGLKQLKGLSGLKGLGF